MRRVPFQSVLELAARRYSGHDPASGRLNALVAATLTGFLQTWVREFWQQWYWPELTLIEQRQFRADWASGTAYGAPTVTAAVEVLHQRSGVYVQALRASTGEEPTDANGVFNFAYWFPCQSSYEGDDHEDGATYTGGIAGTQGSVVRNPADGRYYACHTDHTAGPTLDATKFGVLTPFARLLPYEQSGETKIGEVRDVWDSDPDVNPYACPIKFWLRDTGVIIRGDQPIVWVEFRLRPSTFSGAAYSATATYEAGEGMFYTDDDFYVALEQATAGQTPDTHASKWARQDFPELFREAAALGAAGDAFVAAGRHNEGAAMRREAREMILTEIDTLNRQQRQARPLRVRTR